MGYPVAMKRPPLVIAGVLACAPAVPADGAGGAKPAEPEPKSDQPDPAQSDCAARVAEIRKRLSELSTDPIVINTPDGIQLAESSRGEAVLDGFPIYIREDGTFEVDSRPGADLAALKAWLDEEFDKANQVASITGRLYSQRLLLVADRRAPAATIRDLAAAVTPETTFALVVNLAGDTIPTPPTIPPAVRAAIDDPRADLRSVRLAELITPAIGTCTPVLDLFHEVTTTTSDQRAVVLHRGLPGAIEKCRCQLDVDTLFGAVWLMGARTEPEKRQLTLALSREPTAEAVTLAKDARVADLVQLAETREGKPFRLKPAR